ncbi:MAG: tRNA (N6-isopentenyl adenosine(37)-C2)-methylthiotransferase MiaB [Candidatus Paceibacterota bacterium]
METYHIQTYGCAMNASDSERIAAVLEGAGFTKASNENEAVLVVVNMCSIRQSAVDRVFALANKIRKANPSAKLLLTGCIVKKDLAKFALKYNFVLPIKSLARWPKILGKEKHFGFSEERRMQENELLNIGYLKTQPKYSKQFSVCIPISYGCDNFCTYCVVPYTRGPLVCRSFNDIVKEAKQVVKNGTKEIWLLGQNVNDYKSGKKDFADLIQEINKIPGDFWVRFTSPHPAQVNAKFIETLAKAEKFTPYLNLPVQSGDDQILKAMNRPYTVAKYLDLIKRLRGAFIKYRQGPEKTIAISTDTIVGFPKESEKQFNNTCKLYRKVKFDMAYLAEYSPRQGTPAAKNDNIKNSVKKARYDKLNKILGQTVLANNKRFVGKTLTALVFDKKEGKNIYFAKTRHYTTVVFESDKNLVGQFVDLKIQKAESFVLKGEITKQND